MTIYKIQMWLYNSILNLNKAYIYTCFYYLKMNWDCAINNIHLTYFYTDFLHIFFVKDQTFKY